MTASQIALHVINLTMFCWAIFLYQRALKGVMRSNIASFTKSYMVKECITGIALASVFLILQLDWIFSSHNESVGDATSWGWLVFDYCLALFLTWNAERIRTYVIVANRYCPFYEIKRGELS